MPGHASAIRFDADCDVAALVYRPDEQPDEVIAAFVTDLARRGFDAVGVVQRRTGSAAALPEHELELVSPAGTASLGTLSAATFAVAQTRLTAALARRPALLVINRFGSAEARGGGLIEVLREAVASDVPVLLAVPAGLFEAWLQFSQGLAVRLSCRRASLHWWWRSLGREPPFERPGATFCEAFK